MSKKDDKELLNNELNEELEIFGRSKSRDEIKAEQKAQRARELQALRDARRAAKEERKAAPKGKRIDLLVMGAVLLVVLAIGGVLVGTQIAKSNKEALYDPSEEYTGHFYDFDARPSVEEKDVKVVVNELFYTKGEHLCVNMTIGNGYDKTLGLSSLEVKLYNSETQDLIASGYTNAVDETYRLPAGGLNTYTLYIRPEHVKNYQDTLQKITYEITVTPKTVEE